MHLHHASVPAQTIKKIVSLVVIAVAAALFGVAPVPDFALASPQSASLERGRYLVEAVAICFECHSERDFSKAGWPIPAGRMGSGRIMWGEGSANAMVAPNITPDMQTGIGGWSDEEIVRAIQYGIGKDGRLLNPEMPSRYFRSLSHDELRSIVLYLRSIPAVKNSLPAMAKYVPGKHRPGIAMDSIRLGKSSAVVTRGAHLVRIAGCETCHTPTNENGFIPGLAFAGGMIFRHGEQVAASSNLTPDASGMGQYDEGRFVEMMRSGKVGTRELMSAMPWDFYRNMTDGDLKAMFAYLQALPPVNHYVDNTETPTKCTKCGNLHGLGNRN